MFRNIRDIRYNLATFSDHTYRTDFGSLPIDKCQNVFSSGFYYEN